MYLDREAALAKARGEAKFELAQRLNRTYIAIPCPDCGWYQQHMVQILRRRRLLRWALVAALPMIWVGLKWTFTDAETPADLRLPLWVGVSGAVAVIAIVFHFTWMDNLK